MLDDSQAIARSLSQPALFELIFDRHFADVHRYVSQRLGADAADDVAIATNLVRDELRRRRRDGGLTDRLSLQIEPGGTGSRWNPHELDNKL